MKEIVDRLQETRQIELAKSILESKGYKVLLKESSSTGIDIYRVLSNKLGATSVDIISPGKYNNNRQYESTFSNFDTNLAFDTSTNSLEECMEFLRKSISYLEAIGFTVDEETEAPEQEGTREYSAIYTPYVLSRDGESIEVRSNIHMFHGSQKFRVFSTVKVYSENLYNFLSDKKGKSDAKGRKKLDREYDKEAAGGSFSEILLKYKKSGMELREIVDIDKENGDYDEDDNPIAKIASKLGGTLDNIYMFTPEEGGDSEKAYRWIIDSAERSGRKCLSSFSPRRFESWVLCTSDITGDYVEHAAWGYYEVYIKIG